MPGKEGIPQLVLLGIYQRFVGRERAIMLFGQKLISQLSAARPPCRGATPDLSHRGAAYRGDKAAAGFACLLLDDSEFFLPNLNQKTPSSGKKPLFCLIRQFYDFLQQQPLVRPGWSDRWFTGVASKSSFCSAGEACAGPPRRCAAGLMTMG